MPIPGGPQIDGPRLTALLRALAAECAAVAIRLTAYIGALAAIALLALDWIPAVWPAEARPAPAPAGWIASSRLQSAFTLSQLPEMTAKTERYQILRQPEGGRKDILAWLPADAAQPLTELEIYRVGGEIAASGLDPLGLAAQSGGPRSAIESAGVLDTKLGRFALYRGGDAAARSCLGFVRNIDLPPLRISGWTCDGETIAAQRALIGGLLDRLTLVSAAGDPRLAELFAQAELSRDACASQAPAAKSSDWIAELAEPRLRGRL